jgi:transcription elongation factor Elf1
MIADGKKIKKIKCPHCGHEQNIFYAVGASCRGLFFKCKNAACRKEFEIRL